MRRTEESRVDESIQRRVVSLRHRIGGQIPLVVRKIPERERTDHFRAEAISPCDFPGDLRLLHSLRVRQTPEIKKDKIPEQPAHGRQHQKCGRQLHPAAPCGAWKAEVSIASRQHRFSGRTHLVQLPVQRAAADAEPDRRLALVAVALLERAQDEPVLALVQIDRIALLRHRPRSERPSSRSDRGRSRIVILGPFDITTPCSIAVRSSRTLPGQP